MNFIKILFIALLLTACSSTHITTQPTSSGLSPLEQSASEQSEYKKAIVYLNSGNFEKAKEIFTRFRSERPELAGPYANLAIIALKENNPDDAFKLVTIAVQKNPKLAQALNLLGYLEQQKGDVSSAVKHYKQAIENYENYAIAHYNIALLYDVYLQDIDKAIPHYEKYLKLINNKDKKTADWLEQIKQNKERG